MKEDEHGTGWFTGPGFLRDDEKNWPTVAIPPLDENDIEIKKRSVLVALGIVAHNQPVINPLRYSSWMKLLRVVGWVFRWINNTRKTVAGEIDEKKDDQTLTPIEISYSQIFIVKDVQRVAFDDVLLTLQYGKSLPKDHKIIQLSPFIDVSGALRVGGCLEHAPIPSASKH